MSTYLDAILEHHRARALAEEADLGALKDAVEDAGLPRDFAAALRAGRASEGIAVIAEIKRRSPSKGTFVENLDPASLARAYQAGGASCLSVLTDEPHFDGSAADLEQARNAVSLPVLRKDFTVCAADLYRTRLMGADACLLIVAALDDDELAAFHDLANELSLTALVEIHDEHELERALSVGARVIGVNQRDLHSFSVDRARACRVGAAIPSSCLRVAESGIATHGDVTALLEVGFDAVLVGEALVTADDPAAALFALVHGDDEQHGKMH